MGRRGICCTRNWHDVFVVADGLLKNCRPFAKFVEGEVEILVCARRVPDTSENEIQLNSAGNDIERDDLVYSINEPDNYAVEEALQIVAKSGGNVTVATVGTDEDAGNSNMLMTGLNHTRAISWYPAAVGCRPS